MDTGILFSLVCCWIVIALNLAQWAWHYFARKREKKATEEFQRLLEEEIARYKKLVSGQ